jgi:RimJ/RimL family protein N-acetyltransferase
MPDTTLTSPAQPGAQPTEAPPLPKTSRLAFARFSESDAEALGVLLGDPEIARTITANASTPETRAACARHRIAWHNAAWQTRGYGVWALRAGGLPGELGGRMIGWCGFAEPDPNPDLGADPEILYGLARDLWGRGLASEAAAAAIDWLFTHSDAGGVSALIMARLNPASLKVTERLGFVRRGTMSFADFLPDRKLARDVLAYEIWRLGEGATLDPEALLFQAPYKAGQIAAIGIAEERATVAALSAAARRRPDFAGRDPAELAGRVRDAFGQGMKESHMDRYHLPRAAWQGI